MLRKMNGHFSLDVLVNRVSECVDSCLSAVITSLHHGPGRILLSLCF
jgi:hypothetical protein